MQQAGFHGYLHKPVSVELLLNTVAQVAQGQSGFSHLENEQTSRIKLLDDERAIAVNGKAEHAQNMRRALADDLRNKRPLLEQTMANADYETAAQLAHQWAGGAGYAGANGLERACRAFEACLLNDLDSSPGTHYLEVLRRLDCTVAAIDLDRPVQA